MERRFTGLLVPILIVTLLYFLFLGPGAQPEATPDTFADPARNDPAVQAQIDAQPTHPPEPVAPVVRQFGERGGQGFRVTFSRYGAGVRAVTFNDEYVSTEARDAAERNGDAPDSSYYPIVPAYKEARRYGLVLEGVGKTRFAKSIDDGAKNQLWEVVPAPLNANEARFFLDMGDGLILHKVFRYQPGRRDIQVVIELECTAAREPDAPSRYEVLLRGCHLFNPEAEQLLQNAALAMGALLDPEGEQTVMALSASEAAGKMLIDRQGSDRFQFAGTTNRFFAGFLYPEGIANEANGTGQAAAGQRVEEVRCGSWPPRRYEERGPDGEIAFTLAARSVPEVYFKLGLEVPPIGQKNTLGYRLYLGPKSSSVFDEQPAYAMFDPIMTRDLTTQCCCSVPGIAELSRLIVGVLKGFQALVGNWGWAIVMLTLLVRILLSPLNFNMQRTMRVYGAKMATLKPQMEKIQQQYKDDPKKLQMEMLRFNKEHKLMTAPLKGCLPILVTMPIWFGLFTSLRVMYELRHAGFISPIDDLSQPDRLIELGFTWLPYLNVLPLVMVALWLYLQMATPLPKDPQQRGMMKMMRFMPIMMGIFLYNYASGLMIYMCTSSLWGIVEQKVTKRILGPVSAEASGMAPMPMM